MNDDIEDAVRWVAGQWVLFAPGLDGLDENRLVGAVKQFSGTCRKSIESRFRQLRKAPPELLLLVICEGIALSGIHSRQTLETRLGIRLPMVPLVAG